MNKFGKYIDNLIKEKGTELSEKGKVAKGRKLSRNYVAKEILGVSGTWFSGIVNGVFEPSDELVIEIADYFEEDERYLFFLLSRVHPNDLLEFKESYLEKMQDLYTKQD